MSNRRTIPEIRAEMFEHADRATPAQIRGWAEELKRRPPVKRASPRARGVTPELAERVRLYALAHPTTPNRDIGHHFDIDGGRVSEILAGKRGE